MALPNLLVLTKEALVRRGADLARIKCRSGAAWPKPPLFTALELDGVALMDYVRVETPTRQDDFVQAYESFLDGYLFSTRDHKLNPYRFVATVAQLPGHKARGLLTHYKRREWPMPLHLMGTLIEFAAIAAYTWPCEIIEGCTNFIATTDEGFSFGVVNGRPVSNLERPDFPPVLALTSLRGLAQRPRGEPLISKVPSRLDGMRLWLEENAEAVGEQDYAALLTAMQIVRWFYPIYVSQDDA